ncbi:MAG TPA: helix-turn-helix domain-containing protein [Humibacillus xanthopallidus]|nr:helix-turn-helix domain-containing protein [Humibacillus xanthopallidus]
MGQGCGATGVGSGLRADAERNRLRIVEAAREVFAEEGIDAPLNEVARRAEVGIATLFRRFPTRDDLVTAVFADRMSAYAAAVERAHAEPDPWLGFCRYLEQVCAMQVGDRGFTDVMTQSFPRFRSFEDERRRSLDRFGDLVTRAQQAGRLRADFVVEDLPLLLMANAGVVSGMGDAAPDAWRRLVTYLVQAFAAETAEGPVATTQPLPEAPTPRQVARALARVQARAARGPGRAQ